LREVFKQLEERSTRYVPLSLALLVPVWVLTYGDDILACG